MPLFKLSTSAMLHKPSSILSVYKKKGIRINGTTPQALEIVRFHELSLKAVASTFSISKSMLSHHLKELSSKQYRECSTMLTPNEES